MGFGVVAGGLGRVVGLEMTVWMAWVRVRWERVRRKEEVRAWAVWC